ncbi:SAM-dependent methyltransferase [uncultured Sphingomonas sp.]|uniref:class I SAM-dependent methyltransferase n=1 Tax=uncultured Sphingomonas sp. TaxID=158754 RepID=UPI0025ECE1EE|nr:SAM-dependent methyltransferase [uncultured Sphingomonas sp.]
MPASPDLSAEIARLIAAEEPISIERYMALANAHYYATHAAIGAEGDFITAPEISQMFGEMIGLVLADTWQRAGSPGVALVELGPGRGTLAADMLRAMRVAGLAPPLHLVETSPLLQARQRALHPDATWHDGVDTLPGDRPLLIVANEFFDALPVRQLVNTVNGWRERMVGQGLDGLEARPGDVSHDRDVPAAVRHADPGSIVESAPAAGAVMRRLAERLHQQGGLLIAIDYGHDGGAHGDTLQAVHAHAYADPFARPGASDLTAHVDFAALAASARDAGAHVTRVVPQGQWLIALGLTNRAAALGRAAPARADEIATAYRRLTHPDEMGELFKVISVVAPGWPEPGGFQ